MNRKVQTTTWLDFLTYILLPLVIIGNSYSIISTLMHSKLELYTVLIAIVEIFFVIFYAYTIYRTHKRSEVAPKLLYILFWLTALQTSADFANTECINKGYNFFLMFALYLFFCYVIWIRTNQVYLEKRKDLFISKNALKNTYRCSKCKRLVPNGKECPNCKKEKKEEKVEKEEKKVDKRSTEKEK